MNIQLNALLTACIMGIAGYAYGQTGVIRGTVTDRGTNETLIGATVVYDDGKGTVTDIDGRYELTLPQGTYTLTVSYVGYEKVTRTVNLGGFAEVNFALSTTTLREVEVIADLAVEKETPVAFSNITPKQITQEIGTSELPLLLNTTPGVYVSPTGGGDGGARVAIRGFQDRNITVMIDGIPINNMDNGNVLWASTYGIDGVLANMQVQRGMTSSRLAIPAIGGTINFITKSIENEESFTVSQDYGSFNTMRTSIGYNSGRLDNGWGFSVAGSFRNSSGYADQQFKDEYFYYLKVQRQIGNHIISATALGSPVQYGMRRDKQKIVVYDKDFAADLFRGDDDLYRRLANYNVAYNTYRRNESHISVLDSLGEAYGWTREDFFRISSENDFIDTTGVNSLGYRYNNHWGYLNGGILSESMRDYHKPIFSLRDFWEISDNLFLSNVLYYSFGTGGNTSRRPRLGYGDYDLNNMQVNFQNDYNNNVSGLFGPPIDPTIHPSLLKSTTMLAKDFDNHYWVGWLSTVDWTINDDWTFAGGLDFRTYQSEQYMEVHNLLGGDYFVPSPDDRSENLAPTGEALMYRKGDKMGYYNDNFMRWGAFFTEMKYNKENWRAFVNISGVITGYRRVDYFANRDLVIDGRRFPNAIGYGDVAFYNGTDLLVAAGTPNGIMPTIDDTSSAVTTTVRNPSNNYNEYAPTGTHTIDNARRINYGDPETQVSETPWKNIPGYTVKAGTSYLINEFQTVFTNLGYISRTPRFRNVVEFGTFNQFMHDIGNENIASVELGYSFSNTRLAFNVNGYYTDWRNRPVNSPPTIFMPDRGISVRSNLHDMNAIHQGVEFSFKYNISEKMTLEGFASFGDWRWNSSKTVYFYDDRGRQVMQVDGNNNPIDSLPVSISFDAKGVFVGDAPQTQIGGSFQYSFTKDAYIKVRYTHFDKHYSNFDPLQLHADNPNRAGRQSWKLPGYGMTGLYAGYRFDLNGTKLDVNVAVDNLFDIRYIADGQNNEGTALVYTDYLNGTREATVNFDANSTGVYFGLPRVVSVSLTANF